jgi:hypothetical protein
MYKHNSWLRNIRRIYNFIRVSKFTRTELFPTSSSPPLHATSHLKTQFRSGRTTTHNPNITTIHAKHYTSETWPLKTTSWVCALRLLVSTLHLYRHVNPANTRPANMSALGIRPAADIVTVKGPDHLWSRSENGLTTKRPLWRSCLTCSATSCCSSFIASSCKGLSGVHYWTVGCVNGHATSVKDGREESATEFRGLINITNHLSRAHFRIDCFIFLTFVKTLFHFSKASFQSKHTFIIFFAV